MWRILTSVCHHGYLIRVQACERGRPGRFFSRQLNRKNSRQLMASTLTKKKRSWHNTIKGEGAITSKVELINPEIFQFGDSRGLAASEQEKRQAASDFCAGLLECQSNLGHSSHYSLPRGTLPSLRTQHQQQLIHHPTVDLKRINLLDLQSVPGAYLRPEAVAELAAGAGTCLLYTSPSPRDRTRSRMPSSA